MNKIAWTGDRFECNSPELEEAIGQKLEICAYSFQSLLHPLLRQALVKWFGGRSAEDIDRKCPYFSGSYELKCAVNPSTPCKDCSDVSAGFDESLFVWNNRDFDPLVRQFLQIDQARREGRGEDL